MIDRAFMTAESVDSPILRVPRMLESPRYIYVVQDLFIGAKVGVTLRPKDRMKSIFSSKGKRTHVRAHVFGPIRFGFLLESEIKKRLDDQRIIGEWFDIPFLKMVDVCRSVISSAPKEIPFHPIKTERIQLGLTQQSFARKMGVSCIKVSAWERGVMVPKEKDIKTMAAARKRTERIAKASWPEGW